MKMVNMDEGYKAIELTVAKILKEHLLDKELINSITKEFLNKKLDAKVIPMLFEESISLNSFVKEIEYQYDCMAFLQGVYNHTGHKEYRLENFYTDEEIARYEAYTYEEIIPTQIVFKNAQCLELGKKYQAYLTLEQVAEYEENNMWFYNIDTQRKPRKRFIGTKQYEIKEGDVNYEAVEQIKQKMLDDDYEYDQIILNIRKLGREYNVPFKFNPTDITDIVIKPNYNRESKDYAVVDKIDGQHRILAMKEAVRYCKNHNLPIPQKRIPVLLVYRSVEEAKKIVKQIFTRTDTNLEYLNATITTDYSRFVDTMLENCDFMKGKVAMDSEDYKSGAYYTTKEILTESVKQFGNVDFNNLVQVITTAEDYGRMLNDLLTYIKSKHSINSWYFGKKMFIAYLSFVNLKIDSGNPIHEIMNFENKLENSPIKAELNSSKKYETLYKVFTEIITQEV